MRFAGLFGEGRRNGQKRRAGFGERPIERRETQIVAHREAETPPWQIADHGEIAGAVIVGFAIALAAGEVDVEHMDLVVARRDFALAIDQEGAVYGFVGRCLDGERADMNEGRRLARDLAQGRKRRVLFLGNNSGEQLLALERQNIGHFRCEHIIGAGAFGFIDQRQGGTEIGLRIEA